MHPARSTETGGGAAAQDGESSDEDERAQDETSDDRDRDNEVPFATHDTNDGELQDVVRQRAVLSLIRVCCHVCIVCCGYVCVLFITCCMGCMGCCTGPNTPVLVCVHGLHATTRSHTQSHAATCNHAQPPATTRNHMQTSNMHCSTMTHPLQHTLQAVVRGDVDDEDAPVDLASPDISAMQGDTAVAAAAAAAAQRRAEEASAAQLADLRVRLAAGLKHYFHSKHAEGLLAAKVHGRACCCYLVLVVDDVVVCCTVYER